MSFKDASSAAATNETYHSPFGETGIVLAATLIIPLCIFGILANLLTICVIAVSPKLRSIFNRIILSLCVSDLISSVISVFELYRRTWGFEYWMFSDGLCKIVWAIQWWTRVATAFHILSFTAVRFISLQSISAYNSIKESYVKITLVALWTSSCLLAFVPNIIFSGVSVRDRLSNVPSSNWPSCSISPEWVHTVEIYSRIGYATSFYLPLILITALSAGVIVKLLNLRRVRQGLRGASKHAEIKEAKQQRRERQVFLQLVLIVGSFLFGYIPFTAYYIYSIIMDGHNIVEDWWFGISAYFLLRISECLNPVFYNIASRKMRRETKRVIRNLMDKTCCRCLIESKPLTAISVDSSSATERRIFKL